MMIPSGWDQSSYNCL